MLSFIFIKCIESFLGFHIVLSIVYCNNFVCVLICTSMILYPTYFKLSVFVWLTLYYLYAFIITRLLSQPISSSSSSFLSLSSLWPISYSYCLERMMDLWTVCVCMYVCMYVLHSCIVEVQFHVFLTLALAGSLYSFTLTHTLEAWWVNKSTDKGKHLCP